MHKVKIIAEDIEQFKQIELLLSKLPEQIYSQIESAGLSMAGIECIIIDKYDKIQTIMLPNITTQIHYFEDYIGIYCDKYFFKLTKDLFNKKCNFGFIECENLKS